MTTHGQGRGVARRARAILAALVLLAGWRAAAQALGCGTPTVRPDLVELSCLGGLTTQWIDPAPLPGEARGNQRLLVIIARLAGQSADPATAADVEAALLNGADSFSAYLEEVSYGQAWIDPTTTVILGDLPPLSLPIDVSTKELTAAAMRAVDPLIDFRQFDRVLVVANGSFPQQGAGSIGRQSFTCDGGVRLGVAITLDWDDRFVLFHELMHTFYARHSVVLTCPDAIGASCRYDGTDNVGCCSQRHPSAETKRRFEWLTATDVPATGGSYQLTALELDAPGSIQELRVARGGPAACIWSDSEQLSYDGWYVLEYRAPLGLDARPHPIIEGVTIYVAGDSGEINLLNLESNNPVRDLFNGHAPPGRTVLLDGPQPLFLQVGDVDSLTHQVAVRLDQFRVAWPLDDRVAIDPSGLVATRLVGRRVAGAELTFARAGAPGSALWRAGDVNMNGAIDSSDLTLITAWSLGRGVPPDAERRLLADVDGNGDISGADTAAVASGVAADTRLLLWRPPSTECEATPVTVSVGNGATSMSRSLQLDLSGTRLRRPVPAGERAFGTVNLVVETRCSDPTWAPEDGGALQPLRHRADGLWEATWDTTTSADGDYIGLLVAAGGTTTRFTVLVDNQPPLLQVTGARVSLAAGAPDRFLVTGYLALDGLDMELAAGAATLAFMPVGPFFGQLSVPVTCSDSSHCRGLTRLGDGGYVKLVLSRSSDRWRFTLRARQSLGQLPFTRPTFDMLVCPYVEPGGRACLLGTYPSRQLGNSLKYDGPD